MGTHFFIGISSEPEVANKSLENEPKICLMVAYFYMSMQKSPSLKEKVLSEAWQLLTSCLIFGQNLRLKAKQPSCLYPYKKSV